MSYFYTLNFLAHFYFDRRKDDPHFNFGLLLPDLVRNFEPGTKLRLSGATFNGNVEQSLFEGSLQHVESDKIFHSWEGFNEMMLIVTDAIRGADGNIKKDWFVAHILVELVMDHFLLLKQPDLAKRLYTDFEMLDMVHVQSFLARNHLPNFEQFDTGMGHFMHVRYLEKYHETASIIYALGRICTKVKLTPFTDSQVKLLKQIVHTLVEQMPKKVSELHEELA